MEFVVENLRGLAGIEGRPDAVQVTPERLAELALGPGATCTCRVVEALDGVRVTRVGHAWYYFPVPTFTGRPVLYLEDLYIRPEHRRHGIGRSAMAALAREAKAAGCESMHWTVVDSNRAAWAFYESLGAEIKAGITPCKLGGEALANLAASL